MQPTMRAAAAKRLDGSRRRSISTARAGAQQQSAARGCCYRSTGSG